MNAALTDDPVHSKALPDLVTKLLIARQDSLVLYQKLAVLQQPFSPAAPIPHLLQRFRQTLVDYLALGWFEVFQALEDQPADSPYRRAQYLVQHCYSRIASTTHAALAFHDRYDGDLSPIQLADLGEDLSHLGEQLAIRIELEDQIVAAVRKSCDAIAA